MAKVIMFPCRQNACVSTVSSPFVEEAACEFKAEMFTNPRVNRRLVNKCIFICVVLLLIVTMMLIRYRRADHTSRSQQQVPTVPAASLEDRRM
jgi:hypothetical protein